MTNTLFRTGRSSVLNMARDFSCCDRHRRRPVARRRRGPAGARARRRAADAVDARAAPDDLAEGDAFLHNDPYLGNTHTADHTILVPVFIEGEHVFTACAKAHQADCGNADAQHLHAVRARRLRGGRAQLPLRPDPARLRGHRRHHPHVPAPDPGPGHVVRRLPGGDRRGADRRAPGQGAGRHATALETMRAFIAEWLDYSERRMDERDREAARRPGSRLARHPRPDARPPRRGAGQRRGRDRPGAGRIEVDLRDNIDCVGLGINLSESCRDGRRDDRRLQLPRRRRAAQRRQLPPRSTC